MTVQLLVYVITTLFTYILGKISKHFGWNETLPIPIQNILIGIIATIIGCIIHIEGLDANSIIQAVVTASVSYTHLRAHEAEADLVCRLLLEKKKNT